jgi:hypothetical protein
MDERAQHAMKQAQRLTEVQISAAIKLAAASKSTNSNHPVFVAAVLAALVQNYQAVGGPAPEIDGRP